MNQAVKQQQSPPRKNRLAAVVRGKLDRPLRIVMYATDGVGKSTFASKAPAPIFIGAEDGTAQLDVARMPDVRSWGDIIESVEELAAQGHDYKTVVLDTADWAEPMCWDKVVREAGKKHIEDLSYGKGYVAALSEWRQLLSRFERLREAKGTHVIILAHSVIKTFKNPEEGGDFDRYELKLHAKASGLIREWADCVLFANYETLVHEQNGRSKGISTGARIIHTQRRAAFDAKNRYDLPETLPLDWEAFAEAVAAHRPADPGTLRTRITGLLGGVTDDTLAARVRAAVQAAGDDAAELARIANKLSATVSIQENVR